MRRTAIIEKVELEFHGGTKIHMHVVDRDNELFKALQKVMENDHDHPLKVAFYVVKEEEI